MATQVQNTGTTFPKGAVINEKTLAAAINEKGYSEAGGGIAVIEAMQIVAQGAAAGVYKPSETVNKDVYMAYCEGRKRKLGASYVQPDDDSFNTQASKMTSPIRVIYGNGGNFTGLGTEAGLSAWAAYTKAALDAKGGRKQAMLVTMATRTAKEKRRLKPDEIGAIVTEHGGNVKTDDKPAKLGPANKLAAEALRDTAERLHRMREPKRTMDKANKATKAGRVKSALDEDIVSAMVRFEEAAKAFADKLDPPKAK